MFKRLKDCFTCRSNSVKIKSSCLSSCCKNANINVDINGDNQPDLIITKKDSEIEITMLKENEEPKKMEIKKEDVDTKDI